MANEEKRTKLFLHLKKWLERDNPQVKDNIWKALGHVKADYLPRVIGWP